MLRSDSATAVPLLRVTGFNGKQAILIGVSLKKREEFNPCKRLRVRCVSQSVRFLTAKRLGLLIRAAQPILDLKANYPLLFNVLSIRIQEVSQS